MTDCPPMADAPGPPGMPTEVAEARRLRRIVIAAAVTQFTINIDFFSVSVALPQMAIDLDTTTTALQWVLSGYMIALASLFIAGGRLGDIYGRKRLLIIGLVIFAATSALAGSAPTAETAIVFRVLQGAGAAITFPVSLAVVTNAFPQERVQRAIGLVFAIGMIGNALGPFIGGFFTDVLTWRLIFWMNVPISAAVVVLVLSSVDESRDETVPRTLDVKGLALIVIGVAAITYAFDRAAEWGWASASTLGLIAAGLVLLAAFVLTEARVRYPLVDLSLFRIRLFNVLIAAGSVGNVAFSVVIFSSTIYLQTLRDLSPMEAGLAFLFFAGGSVLGAQLVSRIDEVDPWKVMTAALTIGGAGTIALSYTEAWVLYLPAFLVTGFGVGLSWSYASAATQAAVPPEKAGAASGVVLTLLVGLGGIAIAVVASVIETRTGAGLEEAIFELFRVTGVVAIIAGVLVAVFGREPASATQGRTAT